MNAISRSIRANAAEISLPIEGMTCASCVGRVEAALKKVEGVSAVAVNLATERAHIRAAPDVGRQVLVDAVAAAGYGVPVSMTELSIEGMTCASCMGRVEKALTAVPGVTEATVNLATERATVRGHASAGALIAAVNVAGYAAKRFGRSAGETEGAAQRKDAEHAALKRDLIVAAALTFPVVVMEMGPHLFTPIHEAIAQTIGMEASWMIQFALTTLVLFVPGMRFYRRGLPALARLAPDMNALVAVSSLAAYGYSLVATFRSSLLPAGTVNVYYEAAAVIVTLILLGRFMEARAKGHTSEAIKRLAGLQAMTARVQMVPLSAGLCLKTRLSLSVKARQIQFPPCLLPRLNY